MRPALIDSQGKPGTAGYTITDVIVEVLTVGVPFVEVLTLKELLLCVDVVTEVDVTVAVDVETD